MNIYHTVTPYIKGIVHLNIIFSYMKVNKICNLDHPVYYNYLCWFSATFISKHFVFCIIIHMGNSILKKTVLTFSKWLPERLRVQYYNMASFLKSNTAEYLCSYVGFRYFLNNCISYCLNIPI